jgi:purine-binding chemotaxis protein CheW
MIPETKDIIQDQYIIFNLGEEEYAVPITIVEEIVKISNLIKIPQAKTHFAGIMDIRGKIVQMIDLAKRLAIKTRSESTQDRAIVLQIHGKSVGIVVDKVSHVVYLPPSQIDPPPPSVKGISSRYILGVGKKDNRFVILIDIEKILSSEELNDLQSL